MYSNCIAFIARIKYILLINCVYQVHPVDQLCIFTFPYIVPLEESVCVWHDACGADDEVTAHHPPIGQPDVDGPHPYSGGHRQLTFDLCPGPVVMIIIPGRSHIQHEKNVMLRKRWNGGSHRSPTQEGEGVSGGLRR